MLLPNQIAASLTDQQRAHLANRAPIRAFGFDLVIKHDDGVCRRTDLGCKVLDILDREIWGA